MFVRNITYYENRIALLKSRAGRENASIVAKLERKLRKINSNR